MATAAQVAQFRQAQSDVVTLALRELEAFWRSLDTDDPYAAVRALERFLPELVQAYGEIGAGVAADFYEDLRSQSPAVRQAYSAIMADVVPLEQATASARWAAGPLFAEVADREGALARVVKMTDRLVKAPGRTTLLDNVERDPARARFARVPTGTSTCAFCLMLASRGAVYSSGREAGWEMGKYHDLCDCVPTPMWDGDAYPDGYDPKALKDIYKRGLKASETGDLNGPEGVLNAIRRMQNDT